MLEKQDIILKNCAIGVTVNNEGKRRANFVLPCDKVIHCKEADKRLKIRSDRVVYICGDTALCNHAGCGHNTFKTYERVRQELLVYNKHQLQ